MALVEKVFAMTNETKKATLGQVLHEEWTNFKDNIYGGTFRTVVLAAAGFAAGYLLVFFGLSHPAGIVGLLLGLIAITGATLRGHNHDGGDYGFLATGFRIMYRNLNVIAPALGGVVVASLGLLVS